MSPLLPMLLQAQAVAVPAGDYGDFDLADVRPATAQCGEAEGEILVCGRQKEPERVTRDFSEKPVRAEKSLGGGWTGSFEGQQRGVGPGVSVPAAMITFRLHF